MSVVTTWSRVEVAERMTAAEFWQEAPDDRKAELIKGVMLMAPPLLDIHEKLQPKDSGSILPGSGHKNVLFPSVRRLC